MNKLTLANVGLHMPIDDGRNLEPGVIHMANEERFTAAHFSEALTAYATGWQDPENIQETLDAMAPPIEISRRFEYKKADSSEAFLSETDDIRAIGSPFKRVEYKGESANEKTYNKGLTIRLDHDEMVDGSEELNIARLLKRLNRNELRRTVTLLVANCTNSAKTWDDTAKKDPDMDVFQDLDTGGDARGIRSNLVVYGQTAWTKRVLSHRAQDIAGQGASARMTLDELAGFLAVDKVMVSRERYQSSASAKSRIVAAYVLMYYAEQNMSKDDPSNIKQFWTPTESGRYRVYRQERAKFTDLSVEHYSNIVMPSTLGARKFTVS